jgi:hypothetical protein
MKRCVPIVDWCVGATTTSVINSVTGMGLIEPEHYYSFSVLNVFEACVSEIFICPSKTLSVFKVCIASRRRSYSLGPFFFLFKLSGFSFKYAMLLLFEFILF